MEKRLLKNDELMSMIRKCYESDTEHMLKYHVTGDLGLDYCVNRTLFDFVLSNINAYALENNGEFIGYFGDEWCSPDRWLTGFFIMPEKRKELKKDVWNIIIEHFKGPFKSGLYDKNEPAKKFLIKNGCKLVKEVNAPLGFACVFEYNKEIVCL
jgi:hypothetical protein